MIKKYILLNLLLLIFVTEAGAMQPDGLQKKREEGPPEHQIKQRDWKYSQRAYPLGSIPWDAYLRAFRQTQEYTADLLFNTTEEADQWVNIGPASHSEWFERRQGKWSYNDDSCRSEQP